MRLKATLYVILFLLYSSVAAQKNTDQTEVTITGRVIESSTQLPISFANIGFQGKGIGTVSDADGNFSLEFKIGAIKNSDKLLISVLGYETVMFTKIQIIQYLEKELIIPLNPNNYELESAVIENVKRRTITIGNLDTKNAETLLGIWKDREALGGEILTKLRVKQKNTKFKSFRFHVLANFSDSIVIRLNIYNISRNTPSQSLLNESIIKVVKTKSGVLEIPLDDYNILVNDDVLIGIELLEVYGDKIGFSVLGRKNVQGISLTRERSQDSYQRRNGVSMNFQITATIPDKRKNTVQKRENPEEIFLYWDASAKANEGSLSKKLDILETYLNKIDNVQVTVIKFAAGYIETNAFSISKGRGAALLSYLENTRYLGAPIFEELPRPKVKSKSIALLFTSGETILSDLDPNFRIPTFTITSNTNADFKALENLSIFSEGDFLPIFAMNPKEAVTRLITYVNEDPLLTYDPNLNIVSGIVSSELGPLQGARVRLQNSYNEVSTNSEGYFNLEALKGDVLQISFPGMSTTTWTVQSNKENTIFLEANTEILESAPLKSTKNDLELINTPKGKVSRASIGYSLSELKANDIPNTAVTLADVLRRIPELQVIREKGSPSTEIFVFPKLFSLDSLIPIIVIDETVFVQGGGSILPVIPPQFIKKVSATSSIAAAVKYGTIANGGIINIATAQAASSSDEIPNKNNLLLKENIHTGDVQEGNLQSNPLIIQLENAQSLIEAKNIFYANLERSTNSDIATLMESYTYFKPKIPEFAKRIITSLAVMAPNNDHILTALAFALEDLDQIPLLILLRKRLLDIAPDNSNNYRALAAAYVLNKQYQEAFDIYKKLLLNNDLQLQSEPLRLIVEHEMRRLTTLYKSKISTQDLPDEYLTPDPKKKAYLLFELNNPQAAFEIQFINPNKRHFNWTHDFEYDLDQIKNVVQKGYAIKTFEIAEDIPGDWLVDAVTFPNENNENTYLKYTLYLNYATKKEFKKSKIIALSELTDKQIIDTITIEK